MALVVDGGFGGVFGGLVACGSRDGFQDLCGADAETADAGASERLLCDVVAHQCCAPSLLDFFCPQWYSNEASKAF